MWTMENTEGFTQPELDTINTCLDRVMEMADTADLEPSSINDAINNAWRAGITSDELVSTVAARLGL